MASGAAVESSQFPRVREALFFLSEHTWSLPQAFCNLDVSWSILAVFVMCFYEGTFLASSRRTFGAKSSNGSATRKHRSHSDLWFFLTSWLGGQRRAMSPTLMRPFLMCPSGVNGLRIPSADPSQRPGAVSGRDTDCGFCRAQLSRLDGQLCGDSHIDGVT